MPMLLVVGLGNPGREYASHRHNVGFMAVDELAKRVSADSFREKFSGLYARAELGDEEAVFLKPMTYMNESGRSVQPAMAFFKIAPKNVIVLHDELDIAFGEIRLKLGGGHAGHNGLRSIMASMGTGDFGRVRLGIGRPPPGFRGEVADYVLSSFDSMERALIPDMLKGAADAVIDITRRGFDSAMNTRNTRPKPKKSKTESTTKKPAEPFGKTSSEPVAEAGGKSPPTDPRGST